MNDLDFFLWFIAQHDLGIIFSICAGIALAWIIANKGV